MAELLVMAEGGPGQTGAIITAQPDGHAWGTEEGPPKFLVLRVTDLSVADARELSRPDTRRVQWRIGGDVVLEDLEPVDSRVCRVDTAAIDVSGGLVDLTLDQLLAAATRPETSNPFPADHVGKRLPPLETVRRPLNQHPYAPLHPRRGGDPDRWQRFTEKRARLG